MVAIVVNFHVHTETHTGSCSDPEIKEDDHYITETIKLPDSHVIYDEDDIDLHYLSQLNLNSTWSCPLSDGKCESHSYKTALSAWVKTDDNDCKGRNSTKRLRVTFKIHKESHAGRCFEADVKVEEKNITKIIEIDEDLIKYDKDGSIVLSCLSHLNRKHNGCQYKDSIKCPCVNTREVIAVKDISM